MAGEDEKKGKRGRPPGPQTALGVWLDAHPDWTKEKMAEALGIGVPHLYALCNGRKTPTKIMTLAVAHLTNGEVPPEAWEKTED